MVAQIWRKVMGFINITLMLLSYNTAFLKCASKMPQENQTQSFSWPDVGWKTWHSSSEKVGFILSRYLFWERPRLNLLLMLRLRMVKQRPSTLQFWINLIQTTFQWKSFLGWGQMALQSWQIVTIVCCVTTKGKCQNSFCWCVAHKLPLVAHWASKAAPYLVSYEEIVKSIYNFFQYSAVRYNKLKELKNLMNQKVQRFKKPTQVQWLST